MNLQLAQVYLRHGAPALSARTWLNVMEQIKSTKKANTLLRWEGAIKDSAFDLIRHRKLIETTADDFFVCSKPARSRRMFTCGAFTISRWTCIGCHCRSYAAVMSINQGVFERPMLI
jgi:hypothetical protein